MSYEVKGYEVVESIYIGGEDGQFLEVDCVVIKIHL